MQKTFDNLEYSLNNCPIPVVVEFSDGLELPIQKAYRVYGRGGAIKILVDDGNLNYRHDIEIEKLQDRIDELEVDLQETKELEEQLAEWTDKFGDDPWVTSNQWDAIEESVKQFADIAGISLVADDSQNINKLCAKYEDLVSDLKTADEVIEKQELEISRLKKVIKNAKLEPVNAL